MKKIITNTIFLLISILLLVYAFKGVKLYEILEYFKRTNYTYIILSSLIGFLAYILRGMRGVLLVKSMGYNTSNKNSINSVSISYFFNLIFPRAGEVVRCTTLSKLDNIPTDKLLGTIVLERIIDLMFLMFIILLGITLERESIINFFEEIFSLRSNNSEGGNNKILYLMIISILFIVIVFSRKKITNTILYKKIKEFLIGMKNGLNSFKAVQNKYYFIFLSISIWVCYFSMVYVISFSLKETSFLDVGKSLILLIAGGLAMIVPVQGGIGSYHLAIKIVLMFYGVSELVSISFATIIHTTHTFVALIFGGIAFIQVSFQLKEKIKL